MSRIATQDGYALETLPGMDDPVRRLVRAGDPIPDHWDYDHTVERDGPVVLTAQRMDAESGRPLTREQAEGAAPDSVTGVATVQTDTIAAMDGEALDAALESRGLSKTGTMAAKRRRLREADAGTGNAPGAGSTTE
jgi:hypothetical protein